MRKAHSVSLENYRLRLLYYTYNGIAWPLVVPALTRDTVFWVLWIGLHVVVPHVIYAISRSRADPRRTERICFVVEAGIVGCAVNEIGYVLWHVFSASAASFISSAAFGGARLLFTSMATFVAGTLLWGSVRGFDFIGPPSLTMEVVGLVGAAVPLAFTAQVNFVILGRLSRARRNIQQRNLQYQSMMEMSVALKRLPDTDALVTQALRDFRELMPEMGFGMVLREPTRPTVVQHAAFNNVNDHSAGLAVRALTQSAGDMDIDGPISIMVGHEPFHILPLSPHLQQLEGFVVIHGPFEDGELTAVLRLFAEQVASALESNLLTQRLERLANTDALTGLYNRAYFDRQMAIAARNKAGLAGTDFSVIMIDLNGLKPINDTYGHEAGDAVLQVAARMLDGAIRDSDVLVRFGGDEFVVLANDCDSTQVPEVTRRIEAVVQGQCVTMPVAESDCIEVRVSLSIGAASSDEMDPEDLLEAADRRMYEDKERFYERLRRRGDHS